MQQGHYIHIRALMLSGVIALSAAGCSCSKTVERPNAPRVEQAELEKKPDEMKDSGPKPAVPTPKTAKEANAGNAAPNKPAPEEPPPERKSEPLATKTKQSGGTDMPQGQTSGQPAKAAEKARQLFAKSRAAAAKGDSDAAMQQGLAAYDQLARHRGDTECDELATGLLKWLEEIGESGPSARSQTSNGKRLKID